MEQLNTPLAPSNSPYGEWHLARHASLLHFAVLAAVLAASVLSLQTSFDTVNGQLAAVATAPLAIEAPYAKGQILVQFKAGVPAAERSAALAGQNASEKAAIPQIDAHVISVPAGAETRVRDALAHNPRIQYAELDYIVTSSLVPNDTYYRNQWFSSIIGEPAGWDISTGSSGVTIAIIDTGASSTPRDIAANLVPGKNILANSSDTNDDNGHGTAVADIAGGVGNNALGVAGPTWNSKLMPIKVLSSTGSGTMSDVASGITYAADHGARVINLSLGATADDTTVQNAVNYAWSKGAVIFAASGNGGANAVMYPAADKNVVAVGATIGTTTSPSGDTRASYSNYGSALDLTAPGSNVYALAIQMGYNLYASWSGTSMASPVASGLAALVLSVNPNLTNSQVVDLMEKNSDDLGASGWDQYYGWGRVNVAKTLAAAGGVTAAPADTSAPTVSVASPVSGATLSGAVTVSVNAADNVGVTKVELYKDGTLYASSATAPYSFYWDTTTVADGSHTLSAKAYDAAGNTAASASVTVSVANATAGSGTTATTTPTTTDTTPPTVTISSPANGTKLKGNGSVTITAAASDASGIATIALMADGATLATCRNTTSCTATWSGKSIAAGTHTITAVATDASANANAATASVSIQK